MSQSDLAKSLGITFQQVQKYERGSNRVSVGKLYRLAEILDVPLTFFFDGLDLPDLKRPPESFAMTEDGQNPILSRRELDLLRAWKSSPDEIADAVASLLRSVSSMADFTEETPAPVSVAAETAAPVIAEPAGTAPKAKPGRPPKAAAAGASATAGGSRRRRGAVWDPADIRNYDDRDKE